MEFKECVDVTVAESGSDFTFAVGLATLRQILDGLKADKGEIRTARPVLVPGGQSGAVWMQKHIVLDAAKVKQLTEHGISELDVILLPWGRFTIDLGDLAARELDRKRELERQTAEAKAMTIHQCAVTICERCLVLFWSLKGQAITDIALVRQNADPEIVRAVASLGEAVRELQPAVLQAINDLLNGEGRVLAALQGIPPPSQAEAKAALGLAIASVRVAHWFNKILERGAPVSVYSDLAPFTAADLEVFFLAGLLANPGVWAGQGEHKHELRSVHVIRLLRANGCKLPKDLDELVLRHSSRNWSGRYVYESELALTNLADAREGEVGAVSFLQRDQAGSEFSIQEELKPFAKMIGDLPVLKGLPSVTTRIFVKRLANKFVAGTLILALTEKFKHQIAEVGLTEIDALTELVKGLTVSSDYNILHKENNLPMMAYALAAIANAFNILPVGALVEFRDENIRGQTAKKMLKLDGGLAVVIYAKDTGDSYSPYLLLVASKQGGLWLKAKERRIIPLGSHPYEKIYRGERRLVVGIISPVVFSQFFSQNVDDIPRYRSGLKKRETGI